MRVISGNLDKTVKVRGDDTEYTVDDRQIVVEGSVDDFSCPNCDSVLVHGSLVIFPASSDIKTGADANAMWCPVCFDVF